MWWQFRPADRSIWSRALAHGGEPPIIVRIAGMLPYYVFSQLDMNEDGVITEDEFVTMLAPESADHARRTLFWVRLAALLLSIRTSWLAHAFAQWQRSHEEEAYSAHLQAARWYQALASREEHVCHKAEEQLLEQAERMSAELLRRAQDAQDADKAHQELQEAHAQAELWRLKAEELEAKAAVCLAHRRGVLGSRSWSPRNGSGRKAAAIDKKSEA